MKNINYGNNSQTCLHLQIPSNNFSKNQFSLMLPSIFPFITIYIQISLKIFLCLKYFPYMQHILPSQCSTIKKYEVLEEKLLSHSYVLFIA